MSTPEWSIDRSLALYNIPGWGAGYFNVNPKGHMVVHPFGQPGPMIDLMDVVDDIRERKLGFPCIVRFQDVLRSRVKQLNEGFKSAISGRPLTRFKESTYFFKLTKYVPRVIQYIKDHPEFLRPEVRRNEVLSKLEQGVDDLSISRASLRVMASPRPDPPNRRVVDESA